uniref:protein phosphatase 1 regulatory subunit 3B-like n=1 Tax=Styela clava TaxID=7725 RepID=UPI00193A9954|nr:protein phosphatase 1 regulatory subunit 3B-like [Styela clava]
MSDRSVLEEAFAKLLVNDGIFDESALSTSPVHYKPLKNIRALSGQCVYNITDIPDDIEVFEDLANNNIERNFSESLIQNGPKRQNSTTPTSPDSKRRKSVTFADSNGGDLVEVREFDNTVDPIQNCLSDHARPNREASCPKYVLQFPQPCANFSDFMRKLFTQKVCLENAQIISEDILIGTLKVQNLSFEKYVHVRLTVDSWKSFFDVEAKFLHSESPDVDVFTFRVQITPGTKSVQFCVRFCCNGMSFWDNNDGANYCVNEREHSGSNIVSRNDG